jgi:Holliday junction DNA helicase RuvB
MKKNKNSIFIKRHNDDLTIDSVLQPKSWNDYIGQERVKRNLKVILRAAQKRKESPDHLLFYGQTGLGKTTLAYLVAKELGVDIKITSGPAINKAGDLVAALSSLEAGNIIFIDECHRLNKSIEEILYSAMESRKLHLVIGKGLGSRLLTIDLPPFTLIAATTRVDLLSSPLRSRFGAVFSFEYYNIQEIKEIIRRSAKILNLEITEEAIALLAKVSRFTPRVANRLLKRSRDFADVNGFKKIDIKIVFQILELLEIDSLGLEPSDRRLLEVIVKKFNNRPVGINTLSAVLGEEKRVIEEIYEPYLLKIGLLKRTSSGRIVTEFAYKHLGFELKDN